MKIHFLFLSIFCLMSLLSLSQKTFQMLIGKNENRNFKNSIVGNNHDFLICSDGAMTGSNTFISRMNQNGKVKWSKTYPFINGSICSTDDNGFFLCNYPDIYSFFIIKCDSNGIVQWSKKITSNSYIFISSKIIYQSASGDFYISGGDFLHSVQLIKLNKKGNLVWHKSFTEPNLNYGLGPVYLSQSKNNNLLLSISVVGCEFYCSYLDFIKFDTSGNLFGYRLSTTGSYESPEPLLLNGAKGLFTISYSNKKMYAYANIDFTRNIIKSRIIPYDIFSLQFYAKKNSWSELINNSLGSLVLKKDWSLIKASTNYYTSQQYTVSLNSYDSVGRICPEYLKPNIDTTSNATIFKLYPFKLNYLFNDVTITDTIIKSTKINEDSIICEGAASDLTKSSSDFSQAKTNISSQIFPNPANKFITVSYSSKQNQSAQIQIFSASGKLVKTEETNLFIGESLKSIDVSKIPAGVYFLKLIAQTEQQNFRFVKE